MQWIRNGLATRIVVIIALVLGAVAGIAQIYRWVTPSPPPVVQVVEEVTDSQSHVGAYAAQFVGTYLSASSSNAADLAQFLTLSGKTINAPAVPATVSAVVVASALPVQSGEGFTLFKSVVGAQVTAYGGQPGPMAWYEVFVVRGGGGLRVLMPPSEIHGAPTGADLPLDYDTDVGASSSVYSVVSGWLTAFMTGKGDLAAYTTGPVTTPLPVRYAQIAVQSVRAAGGVSETPADGDTAAVLVTVNARNAQYVPVTLTYPLTLQAAGGRWGVSEVGSTPLVKTTLVPAPPASAMTPRAGN
ncbi:conjugal transfer protein [Tsukamurella hominis]|uniref:conjugal transfer protein n=1 Tax=Tsukamurella hominis TaxID=1970232 RepID=UPI0039E8ED30